MSPGHEDVRGAGGFAVLPTALPRHLQILKENNSPAVLPSLPSSPSYRYSSSKWIRLDEGRFVAACSTEAASISGARSSPSGAPLTTATLSNQVSLNNIWIMQNTDNATNPTRHHRRPFRGVTYFFTLAQHSDPGHCSVSPRRCPFGEGHDIDAVTQGLHNESYAVANVQAN